MTLGEVLLVLALAAGLPALALHAAGRRPELARHLLRAHVAAVLSALALLVLSFLFSDLSLRYAWAHTRPDYPVWYRLAGVWGGEEGTVLLWGGVVATAALLVLRREGPLHERAAFLLGAFSLVLGLFALRFGVFAATPLERLALAPQGRGLADVLLTPLMVVHPPVQFVAYGLMAVPAAYALAAATGAPREGWSGLAYPWARRAWLFATLALGLGAIWAYYVLSFGGYWAWDPVETSAFLPWLALTAFLHAGKQHMRGEGHALGAPLLAFATMLLTLFATFATRSGLWVSVHAFTDPTDRFEPDAGARLLAILDVHEPTRAFLGAFTALLFLGVAVLSLHHAPPRLRPYARAHAFVLFALAGAAALDAATVWALLLEAARVLGGRPLGLGILLGALVGLPLVLVYLLRDDAKKAPATLSVRTLMGAAVAVLSVALGVAFLLNLQVVNAPARTLFDERAPFLALPLVSILTVALGLAPLGRRGALALAAGGLAFGIVAWFLAPEARVLALASPPLVAAAVATFLKLAHVQGRQAPVALRVAGTLLLASGVLGLVLWSNPPTFVAGRSLPHSLSLALGVAGFAMSALAVLGAIAAFRQRGASLAMAGAAAGVMALGYGVGALLSLAALALVARHARAFQPSRGFLRLEAVRVRETGIYLIHLALVLGLLGYAASTYSQERATFPATPVGTTVDVGGVALRVGEPEAQVDAQGRLDALVVPLHASDGGSSALAFRWSPSGAVYDGQLDVRRGLAQDLYVTPLAFRTAEGWVGADSAAGARIPAGEVDAVTFAVAKLPLMSLVWAGLWMMLLGVALVMVGARHAREPRRVPVRAEGRQKLEEPHPPVAER